MRRIAVVLSTVLVGTVMVSTALAGSPSGNGAQKRALTPTSGSNNSQCQPASNTAADGTNGFALLNLTGPPGNSSGVIQGEVSLKNDTPASQTYSVNLYDPNTQNCTMVGMLATNGHGNGNAHIAFPNAGKGQGYYVVLQDMNNGSSEKYATAPVNLN